MNGRGRTECRSCGEELHPLIDLGVSPLCESFLSEEQANCGEIFYPLDVKLCHECWLAQIGEFVAPTDIFGEYAYFLSYSQAWLDHASDYCATATKRFDRLCFNLGADFIPATGASEREAGQRQRDHTWRA
jgi:hypothetical protein